MSSKPFFSVVLPTLNRAKYIPFAIQSALNQTFGDFELIVSDNSSTDNTEQIVNDFDDARIRYVKTERVLPMYESWEVALSQAQGQYITFLGDDDAHSQVYLKSLAQTIEETNAEIVCCRMADYYYQSNTLKTAPFSNQISVHDSRQTIENIFVDYGLSIGQLTASVNLPLLINAAYQNSILSEIKRKMGRVFPYVLSSDFYTAVTSLIITKQYSELDSPLSFHGVSEQSTTASISSQKKGSNLKETQPALAFFNQVPLGVYIPFNFVADALLTAKSDLGESLNHINIDLTEYFIFAYRQINALELEGNEVSADRKDFDAVLAKQAKDVQDKVKSAIHGGGAALKNEARRKLHKTGVYRLLRKLRDLLKTEDMQHIEGKKYGFTSITDCAKFVDDEFLIKFQSAEKPSSTIAR